LSTARAAGERPRLAIKAIAAKIEACFCFMIGTPRVIGTAWDQDCASGAKA
jgi:hypothetical protein